MEGEELQRLMEEVKVKIGNLIAKPKMADKLLAKPPFRFLHDTISAVCSTTGFGEGLYQGEELDSAAITDKQAKLNYLDKIFTLVGICKGKVLDVKSAKVVSGLEPEFTNSFLIDFADCAADPNYDSAEAVRRTLAGGRPGDQAPPVRGRAQRATPAMAESKGESPFGGDSKPSGDAKGAKGVVADSKGPIDIDPPAGGERGKSRGGTRGGKPNQASTDTGLSGMVAPSAPNLDSEIERCDGTEATTQALLGDLIQRPKLTEKLLSKPPFRFLHDIVMEVIRATGFGTNLYSAAEMDSANVSDKTQKVTFLEKIIKVVGVQLNTLVEAKPQKIVAGLDAQITNNFLQLLAVAAKHMPDSRNAVRTVLEQMGEDVSGLPSAASSSSAAAAPSRPSAPAASSPEHRPVASEEKPSRQRPQPASPAEVKDTIAPPKGDDSSRREVTDVVHDETGGEDGGEDGETKRTARPSTAGRRPPRVKEGAKAVQAKDIAPTAKKVEGIIIDGAADEEEEEIIQEETRLVDEVKSDSKGGPTGNESKLVKDIRGRQVEQEAASKAPKTEIVVEDAKGAANDSSGSGIRLKNLRKTGIDKKGGAAASATMTEGNLEKMRTSIQMLVQQTGPLGVCMDYIQEDIGMMTAELHRWEEECRKYEVEYEEEKRKTKEALHPLKIELADLEDQIVEQMAKISSAKSLNAQNDDKIQQILKLIATS